MSGRGLRSSLCALVGLALVGACSMGPGYQQTEASRAAFAFADRVIQGEQGDLPSKARAAGLVDTGVCEELGGGALYCAALRVNKIGCPSHETARKACKA